MAWTQADLDALETAIKAGVRRVSYTDRTVEYHSLDEMLRLRAAMTDAIQASAGTAPDRCTYGWYSRD